MDSSSFIESGARLYEKPFYVRQMNKVALISLGCAKNLVDSEVMLGHLTQNNYTLVTDLHEADVIIVNTCGFIQPARQEALEAY